MIYRYDERNNRSFVPSEMRRKDTLHSDLSKLILDDNEIDFVKSDEEVGSITNNYI